VLLATHARLRRGASALDAVEQAIRGLEDSGLFNAGLGARAQLDGVPRMDAAIMRGRDLRAGAVAALEGIRHPITAARLVMEQTDHVLIIGGPAARLARHFGLERAPRRRPRTAPPVRRADRMARTLRLFRALRGKPRRAGGLETVGAVALDLHGSLAAGTSTGGIGCMLPGRVGDSPLIGSGLYADDETVAVSMTGVGEHIIRSGVAKEIADRLMGGATVQTATRLALARMVKRVNGSAGALVLDRHGEIVIKHVTPHMAAGYIDAAGIPVVNDRF